MARVRYRIDPAHSRVRVMARSSVHDTEAVWDRLSGTIEVDPDAVADGATAEILVDMSHFDAGDWLKNRKLKKDLDVSKHPEARFMLSELVDVDASGDETAAIAIGAIHWRGHESVVRATGSARISSTDIRATASFDLDVRTLGVTPPKILMIKVEDVVSVSVELRAVAAS